MTGCGLMQAQQRAEAAAKARAQQEAETAGCKEQFPTAPRRNHVAQARCLNEVAARYWTDGANRDLLELFVTKRLAIATQMDEGKISEEDGEVAIAQARADANSELQQRQNAKGAVYAQQAAAAAVMQQATANSLQRAGAALQSINPPPAAMTTCMSTPWAGGVRTTCQ